MISNPHTKDQRSTFRKSCLAIALFFMIGVFAIAHSAFALTNEEELQQKIDERNANIAALEKEIQQYTDLVDKTGEQAKTLQARIKQLENNAKAINLDITKTKNKIDVANLTIQKLGVNIQQSTAKIDSLQQSIARSVNDIYQTEDTSLIETILGDETLSSKILKINSQLGFNDSVQNMIMQLRDEKKKVETDKVLTEAQKQSLVELQTELSDKKKAVDYTKSEQSKVLTDTKNQEQNYQKILADKQAMKAAFEKEVFDYEAKLKYNGNPNELPRAGSSPFAWPLKTVYITQLFGKTVGGEKLYVNGSHNGVDFRASIGTPVMAVADGVVAGTGDTDITCKGASFGRWILIKYSNGLATTYGHLSVISTAQGAAVKAGDVVGYSGNTGYSTGAHLHVSVYPADGVNVENRASAACSGKTYTMPIAAIKAYLDPMLYFPPYNK